MKKHILFLTLLLMSSLTYAQESPPPLSSMKVLTTATRYFNPADSSVWTFKGKDLGWHREGKFNDIEAAKPKIGSGLHLSGDTIKLGGVLDESAIIGMVGDKTFSILRQKTPNTGNYNVSGLNIDKAGVSLATVSTKSDTIKSFGITATDKSIYTGFTNGRVSQGILITVDSSVYQNTKNNSPLYYSPNIDFSSDTNAIAKMAWVNKKVNELNNILKSSNSWSGNQNFLNNIGLDGKTSLNNQFNVGPTGSVNFQYKSGYDQGSFNSMLDGGDLVLNKTGFHTTDGIYEPDVEYRFTSQGLLWNHLKLSTTLETDSKIDSLTSTNASVNGCWTFYNGLKGGNESVNWEIGINPRFGNLGFYSDGNSEPTSSSKIVFNNGKHTAKALEYNPSNFNEERLHFGSERLAYLSDIVNRVDSTTLSTIYLRKTGDTSAVLGYVDSSFIAKTKGVLGSGAAAGLSYNINSSPLINPIGNNSQAVVVLAPGRSHDRNLVGNLVQSDLSYILAGYDNSVNGLMSGVLAGAHIQLGPGVTHTAAVGSLHVTTGTAGYNFLSGTLDSLSNSSFNTVSGYGSKLTNSNYSNHWGNLNSTSNQNYSTIGGTDNLMTASSVTQNNTIIGRLDTLIQTGYSTALGRENAIFGGNYSFINGYKNKVGTSVTVNYNFIASGTGNLSNGSNNFIGSGSNNVTGIYNNVSMLGSSTTASQSNATYVDALIPKNVTASSIAAFDSNKKLVTASQTGTGTTIVASAAPTLTGLVSVNGSANINKNVNDATPSLIVNNQQGSGNIAAFQYAGSQVSNINLSGTYLSATGIANSTNTSNSYVNTSNSGTIISRDIADNNPSLIVNQNNSASTGNIVQFRYQNSGVASVNIGGGFLGTGLINAASSNNAQINTITTGTTIRRNVADNNSALTVNLENASSTAPIQKWQFQGANVATISSSGGINVPSVANMINLNNAKLELSNTGSIISRNVSDANPVLSILNANAASTANLVNFANNVGVKAFINVNGEYENTVVNNGIILKSPNGTRWRLTVTDTGVSQWTSL